MADYKPNYKSVGRWLRSHEAEALLRRPAEQIAARARAAMPQRTGELRARVDVEGGHMARSGDRAAVRIVSSASPYAPLIEFGGRHIKAGHQLRRAL